MSPSELSTQQVLNLSTLTSYSPDLTADEWTRLKAILIQCMNINV